MSEPYNIITMTVNYLPSQLDGRTEIDYRGPYTVTIEKAIDNIIKLHPTWTSMVIVITRKPSP